MHEQSKIDEAAFFLAHMQGSQDDPVAFRYFTSAFLTAARSSLQYAEREARTRARGQSWYQSHVTKEASPVIAFLKVERDDNVHEEPVDAPQIPHEESIVSSNARAAETEVSMTYRDALTKEITRVISHEYPAQTPEPDRPTERLPTRTRYVFDKWPGGDDVLALCDRCLNDIRRIVKDGQDKGFLTPPAA
jgi:hypothetical protein